MRLGEALVVAEARSWVSLPASPAAFSLQRASLRVAEALCAEVARLGSRRTPRM